MRRYRPYITRDPGLARFFAALIPVLSSASTHAAPWTVTFNNPDPIPDNPPSTVCVPFVAGAIRSQAGHSPANE